MLVSSGLRSGLLGLVAAALFSAAAPGQPIEIDSSKGVIDGKVAISFWPAKDARSLKPSNPSGFEVRLVPQSDPDEEVGFPCGIWIQPSPGRYRFWLEGQGWISPFSSVMNFSGGPFQGRGGVAVTEVVPGGLVALDPEVLVTPEIALRLLHLDSHNRGVPQQEMSRRVSGEAIRNGVLMPEGQIIATLYDNARKEYLALGHPVEVSREVLTHVRPEPPAATSTDMLVVLERPGFVVDAADYDVELALRDIERPPDVVVRSSERLYAFWYGLRERYVTLQASSPRVFLEPVDIPLRAGKVEVYRGALRPLPNIDVQLELPDELPRQSLAIEVLDLPGRTPLRRLELPPETTSHRLERLPAKALEVTLEMPHWVLRESVDLSDGESRSLWFRPTPILLEGTVYRGETGHRASILLQTNPLKPRERLVVETDDSGHYEATLFRRGYYSIFIRFQDMQGPPHSEYEPIKESMTLDFHVPASIHRVRVVDVESTDGIAGAQVIADNKFANDRGNSFPSLTDRDGLAELQPLRPGKVVVTATADGYLPSKPLVREVGDDSEEHELTIALRPIGESSSLRMMLPNGTPAIGAQVRVQTALDNALPLWEGTSDREGIVDIPDRADGAWILVRHQQAGSLVRRWYARTGSPNWTLPSASPPLTIRVLRPWGEEPAPWTQLAMWIDTVSVTGRSLAWLASSHVSGTNAQGLWTANNLPRQSLRVLAWTPSSPTDDSPETQISLAVPVDYPWAEIVEIRSVE